MTSTNTSTDSSASSEKSQPILSNYWSTSELYDVGISTISQHITKYHHQPCSATTSVESQQSSSNSNSNNINEITADHLAWRRLHVSKAKLDGVGEIAAFLAGFAVVATVELQINDDANPALLVAFTVTTALLVCTTMMSIMISTCILPHITVVSKIGHPGAAPHESPHDQMRFFIDLSWVLANTISIFLFTLDVILLCWIKYTYFSLTASYCATAIMIPVLLAILIFGVVFYRNVINHQTSIMQLRYEELEELKRNIVHMDSSIKRGQSSGGRLQHV